MAVRGFENENWDIWIHDATRGSKTRLTFHPAAEDNPTWLPSGEAISFSSSRNGNMDLFLKSANGRGEAEVLRATEGNEYGFQWSRDGMHLLFDQVHPDRFMDLYYLRRQPEGGGYERLPIAETPYDELSAHLSPDGRLVAYESNESGRYEVYIQPFPEGEGRWQVSSRGGSQPRWSGAGNEIFYVLDGTIMAVTVRTSPRVSAGEPKPLFEAGDALAGRGHRYDVAADGKRFVLVESVGEAPSPVISVVENWFTEFRDR